MTIYSTPQEEFWAGDFGSEYITRNQDDRLLAANVSFTSAAVLGAISLYFFIRYHDDVFGRSDHYDAGR